jgi:hypothetical protein
MFKVFFMMSRHALSRAGRLRPLRASASLSASAAGATVTRPASHGELPGLSAKSNRFLTRSGPARAERAGLPAPSPLHYAPKFKFLPRRWPRPPRQRRGLESGCRHGCLRYLRRYQPDRRILGLVTVWATSHGALVVTVRDVHRQ